MAMTQNIKQQKGNSHRNQTKKEYLVWNQLDEPKEAIDELQDVDAAGNDGSCEI